MFQLTFLAREDEGYGRHLARLAVEKSLSCSISNNSSIYTKFIEPLKNISTKLDNFSIQLFNSSFYDYIQHYPDRLTEDIYTRIAYDSVRDLKQMKR